PIVSIGSGNPSRLTAFGCAKPSFLASAAGEEPFTRRSIRPKGNLHRERSSGRVTGRETVTTGGRKMAVREAGTEADTDAAEVGQPKTTLERLLAAVGLPDRWWQARRRAGGQRAHARLRQAAWSGGCRE